MDYVVLVDADGNDVGRMEKLAAHRGSGRLHRAFSVFLCDDEDRLLLQRRSPDKHHFRELWSNACCSHPRPGEPVHEAAARRVAEELGLRVRGETLAELGTFVYRAVDPSTGLVEHELDHVLVGRTDADPDPDPAEASEWRWVKRVVLDRELADHPERFTPWLAPALALLPR